MWMKLRTQFNALIMNIKLMPIIMQIIIIKSWLNEYRRIAFRILKIMSKRKSQSKNKKTKLTITIITIINHLNFLVKPKGNNRIKSKRASSILIAQFIISSHSKRQNS